MLRTRKTVSAVLLLLINRSSGFAVISSGALDSGSLCIMPNQQADIRTKEICTPSFVVDRFRLRTQCRHLRATSLKTLYSTKALSLPCVLDSIATEVNGYSVSSAFESLTAAQSSAEGMTVHFTSPGLTERTLDVARFTCTHLSFNSLSQWNMFQSQVGGGLSLGLRINPELSTVEDPRYDPCRTDSKLGASLEEVKAWRCAVGSTSIEGLHFHNSCLAASWTPLITTVHRIESQIPDALHDAKWINVGGGYLWDSATDFAPLEELVERLTRLYGLEVYFEPGAGIVNPACYLVSSVTDLLKRGNKSVAILDTCVNHLPEVFEYQYSPDVLGDTEDGEYEYILAGCSCLAGDLFGEYAFQEPLEIGSRVVFQNVGAYSTVKWHTFNGINLPSIYVLTEEGQLVLEREFTYEDYASRWGRSTHESAPARA